MASVKFYDKAGDEKSLKIQQELKKHFGKVPNVFKAPFVFLPSQEFL